MPKSHRHRVNAGRFRPRGRPPTPAEIALARERLRCPDCDAQVTYIASRQRFDIGHDDGCPALAALRRQGRAWSAIGLPGGDTPRERADSLLAFVAGALALGYAVRADVYGGLNFATRQDRRSGPNDRGPLPE